MPVVQLNAELSFEQLVNAGTQLPQSILIEKASSIFGNY